VTNKAKKANINIDGREYKIIEETTSKEKHWMYIPKVEDGIQASGLHVFEKDKDNAHWDKFIGNKKISEKKEYISPPPKHHAMLINFKNHGIFPLPPENNIAVLRGSDKPMGLISQEYYNKNKQRYLNKYFVRVGDEKNPQILELRNTKC